MNAVYAHLVLNHAPVFILLLSLGLQIYYFKKGIVPGFVNTLVLNIVNLILVFLVMRSGELSSIAVSNIINIDLIRVEKHDLWAHRAFYSIIITGIVSIAGLLLIKIKGVVHFIYRSVLVISTILSVILVGYAAHLGALIRHPEIREIFS